MSVRSSLLGRSEPGIVSSGLLIKKCAGVNVRKSVESLHEEVIGREFIMASVWASNVVNFSLGRVVFRTNCGLQKVSFELLKSCFLKTTEMG